MSFTPFVRWRNFNLKNLKALLSIFPDLNGNVSRNEVLEDLEANLKGYKRTAYQFAMQFGLECKAENFTENTYLHYFDDEKLEQYIKFWFANYVAPNPYVTNKDGDSQINVYKEIANQLLASPNKQINLKEVYKNLFGSDKSYDMIENLYSDYADFLNYDKSTKLLSIDDENLPGLISILDRIEKVGLMKNQTDPQEFFERFSIERFNNFWGINQNKHKFDYICPELRDQVVQEIHFGAPGTGKSYSIKNIIRESYPKYEEKDSNPFVLRTTIYGEYSYFDFVGNIMPTSYEGNVSYKFTEGIFTTALIRAMLNKENDVYLIIEEMSRGDIASIFGDIFQLLDRNDEGISEYRIDNSLISDELIKYGAKVKGDDKIYLPSNLHIIGTVNTSDQNVNVLDTAFKRRFSFVYESVEPSYDESGAIMNSAVFNLADKEMEWNQFYLAINKFIVSELGLSEDKQLGQFFVKFNQGVDINSTIKNKVLHYLWEDVQNASMSDEVSIFNSDIQAFSTLYDKFKAETNASEIFSEAFLETYNNETVELEKKKNEKKDSNLYQ